MIDLPTRILKTDKDISDEAKRSEKRLIKIFKEYGRKIFNAYRKKSHLMGSYRWTSNDDCYFLRSFHPMGRYDYSIVVNPTEDGSDQVSLDGWPPYLESIVFRVSKGKFILIRHLLYVYRGEDVWHSKRVDLYNKELNIKIPIPPPKKNKLFKGVLK